MPKLRVVHLHNTVQYPRGAEFLMDKLQGLSFPADWKRLRIAIQVDRSADTWAWVFENILQARLSTRYLDPIRRMDGPSRGEGFAMLTVQCALIEFLAALRKGWNFQHGYTEKDGTDDLYGNSSQLFIDFLRKEPPFKQFFTKATARTFYTKIRCGLVHEAQTKDGWRVWRGDDSRPLIDHRQKVIYRARMSHYINEYLGAYGAELTGSRALQDAFIRKFDYLYANAQREERAGIEKPTEAPSSSATPNTGLRQARRLSQLSPKRRLAFIAEGLPLIRDSAFGFWNAAVALTEHHREREVLEGFAEEEAAKALILMDIVRCPPSLLNARMRPMLGWFYNHLARLIYAKAMDWKPVNTTQLQEYADHSRKAHDLEGYAGEYILPNWEEYRRESQLYVDIAAYENGEPIWSAPIENGGITFGHFTPAPLKVIDALHHTGLTSAAGLKATAEIWSKVTFRDKEDHQDAKRLTEALLERAIGEGLPLESATQEHVDTLYHRWQTPMYLIDLRKIDVPLDELRERREAMLWAEAGY
jgi:hypothetical protein